MFVTTLEKMARGGVYDQLAGGFHRYSVDERWIVPHFEKMCYDNSELLKNYVHAYQVTGSEFFAAVARDIVRWMDEWLSDREHGGFYASQDADYSMDDDGDYFTWTLAEMQAVLTEEEAAVAGLHYDINEVGEMHHNPEKNVLYVRASLEEIGRRLSLTVEAVPSAAGVGTAKDVRRTPEAADALRGQDSLCGMELALRLGLPGSGESAARLRAPSISPCDRWIASWRKPGSRSRGCSTWLPIPIQPPSAARLRACWMIMPSPPSPASMPMRRPPTSAISILRSASRTRWWTAFSTQYPADSSTPLPSGVEKALGVLGTRRKPFQDSPTPAGNSVAAIALLRLYAFTNQQAIARRQKQTLELPAGLVRKVRDFCRDLRHCGGAFSHVRTRRS